jgi:S-DNA-T family DNA segregation ATPase FtsK/SpoIIIE
MANKPENTHSYITREIPGLIAVFLAITLFLALVSYHPQDPSFSTYSTSGTRAVQNYIGIAGAYLASVLIDLMGLAALWPVLVLLIISWRCFRGRPFDHPWLIVLGIVLLLLSSATAFSMLLNRLDLFWARTPGGGVMGDALAKYLVSIFNPVGASLLVVVVALVALILATGLSVVTAFGALFGWAGAAKARMDEKQALKKEKAERSKRLKEVLEKQKGRSEPKVKEKKDIKPPKPKPKQEIFEFAVTDGPYKLPGLDLLDEPERGQGGMSRDSLMANARLVEKKLGDFNVEGEVVEVSTGPVITMYEYQPAPGVKISKVAGLSDDLAMNMRAVAIRVVAPLPGKAAIGIEIPNPKREYVYLKDVVESPVFSDSKSLLTLVMGVDIMGQPEVADLQKMPHLLIAGATGSGKSVGLNAIIMSILFKAQPDQVRFLMIDPKRIELTPYQDLPHLIYPVVTDPTDANQALKWAVADMENRYQLLAEKGVRNIEAYNRKIMKERAQSPAPKSNNGNGEDDEETPAQPEPLPYLVIIIDELADLMMVSAKEVEASITRLAQMARAAGIHLILATQRPSVDVLTGVIKANLPTRVSFQVSSKIDSRTILDTSGAEKLLGEGDMLFLPPGTGKIRRIHGAYVSETEIRRVTDFIKAQAAPNYLEELNVPKSVGDGENGDEEYDEKYDEAVELVTRNGKASISLIQRHLRIGYNRAARIIETMEREGVVGPADGARPRQVLAREL